MTEQPSAALSTALAYYHAWTGKDLDRAMGALQKNVTEGNVIVESLTGLANVVAGPFGEVNDNGNFNHGVFTLSTNAKDVLVNWGVAAICYLVIGRIVSRVIHP